MYLFLFQVAYEFSWAVPEPLDQCMFGSIKSGREESARFFKEWVEEVKRTVPPEKLLVFEVSQGWAPLCEFLGLPPPDRPFPRVNDTASMQKKVRLLQWTAWAVIVVLPIALAVGIITAIVLATD